MSYPKGYLPLATLAAATLTVATFGFWGGPFLDARAEYPKSFNMEALADDPVPPIRNTAKGEKPSTLDKEWGPSPFLSAVEEKQYGGNLAHVMWTPEKKGTAKKLATQSVLIEPVPVIQALVRSDGEVTVLLDEGLLRIGREADDIRILDRNGNRVLVEHDGDREWLKIISRESLKVNGAGR